MAQYMGFRAALGKPVKESSFYDFDDEGTFESEEKPGSEGGDGETNSFDGEQFVGPDADALNDVLSDSFDNVVDILDAAIDATGIKKVVVEVDDDGDDELEPEKLDPPHKALKAALAGYITKQLGL